MIDFTLTPDSGHNGMTAPFRFDRPPIATRRHGQLRVALYSHDTMGLGHLRRNLLIAETLAEAPTCATSLVISGAVEATFFRLPQRTDCLTLPRWSKDVEGSYNSGRLEVASGDLMQLRSESIRAAVQVFAPDLLIVDKIPAGAFGELLPTLRMLEVQGGTRVVLGIRDVLDTPEAVQREWLSPEAVSVIQRHYDQIWIYGDQRLLDAGREYDFPPALTSKTIYTGLINQSRRVAAEQLATRALLDAIPTQLPLAACVVGGGQDGFQLASQFVEGVVHTGYHGVVVGGPLMPTEQLAELKRLAAAKPNVTVFEFLPESDVLIQRADRVVAMAGYNTVCAVLSFAKNTLLVPRVRPRREQWIRAHRLAELGLVDMADPDTLCEQTIRDWLLSPVQPRPDVGASIDLNGLDTIRECATRLIDGGTTPLSNHTSRSRAL